MEGIDRVAGVVLEPIQGWGSTVYPDEYIPKIRKMCDRLGILLIVDEVLTCCSRTGKMFCVDHYILNKLEKMKDEHKIIGEVRGKGCLLGMELIKDQNTREPFIEAGQKVYQKAFSKGLAWIPAKQNLHMSPPLIMEEG